MTYDFLSDIIEHPEDDFPRLAYADWLEEHGQPERGEFIRVQCELAKPCRLGYSDAWHVDDACPACDPLYRRVRVLFGQQGAAWFGPTGCLTPPNGREQRAGGEFRIVRRGFVAEVFCTVEMWCGQRCTWCDDSPPEPRWEMDQCPDCHGIGRIGAHGPALAKAAPLERVTLTDLDAVPWSDGLYYLIAPVHEGGRLRQLPFSPRNEDRSSRQTVLDAWCRAALDWARRIAGLPAMLRSA